MERHREGRLHIFHFPFSIFHQPHRQRSCRMRTVPKGRSKRINWYKVHAPKWAEDPDGIGTTAAQVAALADMVEEARLARIAQAQTYQTARSATLRLKLALEAMSTAGANIVLQIRAKAGTGGDGIYSKASLPVPRKGSPIAAPGKPGGFKIKLQQIGWLTLTWTCDNPK